MTCGIKSLKLKTGFSLCIREARRVKDDILFQGLVIRPHTTTLEEWFSFDCFEPKEHNFSCKWYEGPICMEEKNTEPKKKVPKRLKSLMSAFKSLEEKVK